MGGHFGGGGGGGNVRPGDWTCTQCNSNCYANRHACFRCGAPKVGNVVTAGGLQEGGGKECLRVFVFIHVHTLVVFCSRLFVKRRLESEVMQHTRVYYHYFYWWWWW